jgi:enamine deaminase RidA (YjgF/YER057c/UK114 family)
MSDIEHRLSELGHILPSAPPPVGYYVPVLRVGNLVVTSGQLPFVGKELAFQGKVGDAVTIEQGQHAARLCVLNALAQIKACIGSLEKITRIARLEGYVHSAPGFEQQPLVLNAASEILAEAFGEAGKHTRVALGISDMPLGAPVQIALWAEVRDE